MRRSLFVRRNTARRLTPKSNGELEAICKRHSIKPNRTHLAFLTNTILDLKSLVREFKRTPQTVSSSSVNLSGKPEPKRVLCRICANQPPVHGQKASLDKQGMISGSQTLPFS